MEKNIFLEKELSDEAKGEISLLYNLGVNLEELEYLIKIRMNGTFEIS